MFPNWVKSRWGISPVASVGSLIVKVEAAPVLGEDRWFDSSWGNNASSSDSCSMMNKSRSLILLIGLKKNREAGSIPAVVSIDLVFWDIFGLTYMRNGSFSGMVQQVRALR